ncbi:MULTISPECIES: VF530 family DNA-binding protein [Shewanella]|uniref:VF530 family DNA-binding protein n=1 Tax=Shewanella metallivivens TaxID=2872342 RepID=A0ABT5TKS6_9GAMM|nr:VF530 family DNA-binding protein [Shewanella metallivivens]MDD8058439.1 VF530 family DNA-binding protein [Shewanella metallivivens]
MVEEQQNNPLHGLKLETLITELVECYDWKILYAALKLECFNLNPSIEGCLKFLKKTEWAREKVENFYLYRYKRMPKAVGDQFDLKPRERGFAAGIVPRKPMELTFESIARMHAQAAENFEANRNAKGPKSSAKAHGSRNSSGYEKRVTSGKSSNRAPSADPSNPWGK